MQGCNWKLDTGCWTPDAGQRTLDSVGHQEETDRMVELRRWALWVAVLATLLAVLVSVGARFFISAPPLGNRLTSLVSDPSSLPEGLSADDLATLNADSFNPDAADPPGLGISYLALTNGLLLIIVGLMALPLLIGNRVGALVNGIVSLIGGLAAVIAGIAMLLIAITALLLMVTLFLAAPFGTLAYLAIFGFFDLSASAMALGFIMLLQIAAIVFLVVAQPKFLGNKRLVFFLLLAVVLTFITMLLHSIVPIILVSITDAIAAVIIAVVGVIWGLMMFIGALIALVKQLNLGRQGGGARRTRNAGKAAVESAPSSVSDHSSGGVTTLTAQNATSSQLTVKTVPSS